MAEKLPPGSGDLTLELQGEGLVLRRSLQALMAFNGYNNRAGIWGVPSREGLIAHLGNSDLPAAAFVIRQGLGIGPAAVRELDERIFEEGVSKVCGQLIPWITSLVEGPKAPGADEGDEGGQAGGGEENPQR